MQATVSKKRFEFGRFGGSLAMVGMAVAFAVGVATGIAGQAIIDDATDATGAAPAIVQLTAYTSAGQGEGLVGTDGRDAAALTAYDIEGMGEGRLAGNAPLAVLPKAHASLGQGEGWISQGRPQPTLSTRLSDGKNEGWVAN